MLIAIVNQSTLVSRGGRRDGDPGGGHPGPARRRPAMGPRTLARTRLQLAQAHYDG
jgi:hypothetical protein